MHADETNGEFNFKAQLDTAVSQSHLCARFEWYGSQTTHDAGQCALLGADVFVDGQVFEKLDETFQIGHPLHPASSQLDHVKIYFFDGCDGSPKFHAYLWKPSMSRDLEPLDYVGADNANPYLPYVHEGLRSQAGPAKVSTVVKQAMKHVRKAKAVLPDHCQKLPMECHELFLRDTLMRLRHTDPFIYFKGSNRMDQPHIDRGAMVEHLSIYDRNPTWDNMGGPS